MKIMNGLNYESILRRIVANGGDCICKKQTPCPCEDLEEELKMNDRCTCGLYIVGKGDYEDKY